MLSVDRTHRIHSILFHVITPGLEEARRAEEAIGRFCKEELPEVLQEVLGLYDREDKVVSIERIELELGTLQAGELTERLKEAICAGLKEFFEENHTLIQSTDRWRPSDRGFSEGESNIKLYSPSVRLMAQLEEFLFSGTLPWNSKETAFTDMDSLVTGLFRESPREMEALLRRAVSREHALKRLVFNLKEESLEMIISRCLGLAEEDLMDILTVIKDVCRVMERYGLKEKGFFLYTSLLKSIARYRWLDRERLFEVWLEDTLKETLKTMSKEELRAFVKECGLLKPEKTTPLYFRLRMYLEETGRSGTTPQSISSPAERGHTVEAFFEALDEPRDTEGLTPFKPETREEQWFVKNSGVVLLWPYLESYFERLKLVKRGSFVSESHRLQAVAELEYLARGDTDYMEYHLVLNKVLCGMELEVAVEPGFRKPPIDKKEAECLLRHAIDNWKKIGRTSVDGFRRAFLMRDGKLSGTEAGWTLLVERKGYDVLLDYLPYPLGVVKLPWMKNALYVEW